MAQSRPPRHSKSKRDPVTIDLEAEKAADDAKKGAGTKTGKASEEPRPTKTAAASTDTTSNETTSTDTKSTSGTAAGQSEGKPRETAKESTPAKEAAVSSDSYADKSAAGKSATEGAGPTDKSSAASGSSKDGGSGTPAGSPAGSGSASGVTPGASRPAGKPDTATSSSSGGPGVSGTSSTRSATVGGATTSARTAETTRTGGPASAKQEAWTGRAFVAGLLGGAAVAIVFYALQATGALPLPATKDGTATQTAASLAALGGEVDALKKSVAGLESAGSGDTGLADIKKQVADLSKALDALRANTGNQAGAGSAEFADLQQAVGGIKDATTQNASDLSGLSDRVATIETKLSQPSDEARIARSVAAAGLKAAIERGGPFDPELQVYASVAPDDPAVAKLKSVASEGIPSERQLVARFPDTADAILAAATQQGADGVFDRLVASARSLVTVRPTGNVEGSTPQAIVARMDVKLGNGDLKSVVDEWNALPEAGKQASQAFIDQVKARLAAEATVDDILRATNASAANATEDGQAQ